jgi:ABC-type nitrate/sulfonate/bicarbonate transport system permease component
MSPVTRALLQGLIGILVVLVLWAALAAHAQNSVLLPSPAVAIGRVGPLLASGELLNHFGSSFAILIAGLGPALVVAVAIAAAADALPRFPLDALVRPLAAAPLIALAPALVLWAGIGAFSTTILVFVVTLFPMLNCAARARGLIAADGTASKSASQAAERHRITIAALSAARLGVMLGVGAVVVGEMFAARAGVGYLLTSFTATFDSAAMMGTLVLILVPTILVGMLLQGIEDQLAG